MEREHPGAARLYPEWQATAGVGQGQALWAWLVYTVKSWEKVRGVRILPGREGMSSFS